MLISKRKGAERKFTQIFSNLLIKNIFFPQRSTFWAVSHKVAFSLAMGTIVKNVNCVIAATE